jgi:hypothetical protein
MELDVRRLYLGEGYSLAVHLLHAALHLAEGAAYNRIEAARAARRVLPHNPRSARGRIGDADHRRSLAPHLTAANHQTVLASARHKGKREVEELVASLRPLPAVPSTIRKLPDLRQCRARYEPRRTHANRRGTEARQMVTPIRMVPRAMETPLAPERYKMQFTISRETHEKLRRAQALARHAIPSGDPRPKSSIVALTSCCWHDLERRRCAAVTSAARGARNGGRLQAHSRVSDTRGLAAR